jgi:hypothetical protein
MVTPTGGSGYWLVATDGGVVSFAGGETDVCSLVPAHYVVL